MTRFRLACLLLLVCPVLRAEEHASTLTPDEIEKGCILLFDGKTTFGWQAPDGSKWTVHDGMLAPQGDRPATLVTTTAFGDCTLRLEFRAKGPRSLTVRTVTDADGKCAPDTELADPAGGGLTWWRLSADVREGRIGAVRYETLGGGLARSTKPATAVEPKRRTGHIALVGTGFVVRNVKLFPHWANSLFNGRDLKGWKEFPGRKSKFSVSKEGWLNVKDGPGDLQTQGEWQWADFVLRADCRTNGKNLNSGIFCRCRPGEYQQGYEAQIHNGFGEKEKEYTLETFDPKSHAPGEKVKLKSKSLDFGTGAIYRRMPARAQLARDNEWFTMVVVAHGRHFATWVNGVQAVDWTDHRPLADNARKGAYLDKGPISLQGHDPTTDLSFRNLQVVELLK